MYVFLDNITFRYKGAQASVLDGLSLFVQSGEIVAIVGPAGAGKTTLLRYVGKRSDGQGGVHIGSDGYESETEPGVIRGWRFSGEGRRVPARVAVGKMAGSGPLKAALLWSFRSTRLLSLNSGGIAPLSLLP